VGFLHFRVEIVRVMASFLYFPQEGGLTMTSRDHANRKFRLIESEGWLGGVCAGLGYYFGISTWIIRLAAFLIVTGTGIGVLPYLALWIFVPDTGGTPDDYEERCG
jgi:phage shock protein PspC (stress-responsive transcriptional regulator)